jgi:large subunit ribosomal protein L4
MANLTVKTYSQQGQVVGSCDLNPAIFGVEIKVGVIHQVVVSQMANSRYNIAYTKSISEVSGGGRKPWKQKGTGRVVHLYGLVELSLSVQMVSVIFPKE